MTINANQTEHDSPTRLRRSVNERTFGGVAAGLATFFGLDVTHVRIAFVALALLGGAGIALYLAAWALIPEESSDTAIAGGLLRSTASRSSCAPLVARAAPPRFLHLQSYCGSKGSS